MPSRWKIWYDDGSTFSSDDGSWEEVPSDGVLIIMEYHGSGQKEIHMSADYYYMEDGTIQHFPLGHLERHLKKHMPSLKYGRYTSEAMWERVQKEALDST